MNIIKKKINNVLVTILKTNKFKSIAGKLYFKSPVTKEKMTYRWVLRDILLDSCLKYDSHQKLYKKALECYDAYYSTSSSRIGNYHITTFTFSSLIDNYTESGNLNNVVDTFCEIVFNPLVKDGKFDKDTFDIILNAKKNDLERIKEDSSAYCERMTYKNMNSTKPYTYMSEIKYLNELTPSKLYQDYLDMMENSEIELILAGEVDFEDEIVEKIVSKIKNNNFFNKKLIITNDDLDNNLSVIKDIGMGSQNVLNLVMYLKNVSSYELNYVAPLYRIILGGGSFSKLFQVIREENSLSYYSFARLEKDDCLMFVIMGIEKEDYDKAFSLTCEVIGQMQKITKKELEEAKLSLISSLLESQDNIFNIISRYYNAKLFNLPQIDEFVNNIKKVTTKQVESFAKKIKPNLCYFLEGE